ncbi:hypothetical protein CJ844_13480 [Salmonella enterica]|nr:hypothetical protein [Salmonella enterica]
MALRLSGLRLSGLRLSGLCRPDKAFTPPSGTVRGLFDPVRAHTIAHMLCACGGRRVIVEH